MSPFWAAMTGLRSKVIPASVTSIPHVSSCCYLEVKKKKTKTTKTKKTAQRVAERAVLLGQCCQNTVFSFIFLAPDGLAGKVAQLGSHIKTCRSHTAACAWVLGPARDCFESVPPLAGAGSRPPQDRPGSQECYNHCDRHLRKKKCGLRIRQQLQAEIKSRASSQSLHLICCCQGSIVSK